MIPSFKCPTCGRKSYHPEDVANRYCLVCGFADDPKPPQETENMPETATESDVNAPIKSSLRDAFINNASYEIWAAFQKKFSEGEKPGRPRWDAMMIQRINSPELGQPFQDCAIEAAVEVYELAVKYLRTGGV